MALDQNLQLTVSENLVRAWGTSMNGIEVNAWGVAPNEDKIPIIRDNEIFIQSSSATGMTLRGLHAADVLENTVTALGTADNYTGIRLRNDQLSDVQCNTVNGTGDLDGQSTAIDIWDAETTHYSCNETGGTNIGVSFAMGSSSPENFKGTTFNDHAVGLRLSETANIGFQTNQGNRWEGSFTSGFGAIHEALIEQDVENSQFLANNDPILFPIFQAVSTQWFIGDFGGTFTCTDGAICVSDDGIAGETTSEFDTKIATEQLQPNVYTDELQWLAARFLYRKLERNPSFITPNSEFETFYNTTSTESIGQFNSIAQATSDIYVLDAAIQTQLENNYVQIAEDLENIANIDSALVVVETSTDSLTLVNQRDSIQNEINDVITIQSGLLNTIIADRSLDSDQVITDNANITTPILYDENEQTVNNIYLNTIAKGVIEFTATQLTELQSIANQCPMGGGSAVFRARSLLALLEDNYYEDDILCNSQGKSRERIESGETKSAFRLHPNPANSQVTLTYAPVDNVKAFLVLYNTNGREVKRYLISAESTTFTFNTEKLEAGVYVCKILPDKGQITYTEKLVIIH